MAKYKNLPGFLEESPSQHSHGFSIQYSSTAVTEYTNSKTAIMLHCLMCMYALLDVKTNIIESVRIEHTTQSQ